MNDISMIFCIRLRQNRIESLVTKVSAKTDIYMFYKLVQTRNSQNLRHSIKLNVFPFGYF
jgi:hypothetical protein